MGLVARMAQRVAVMYLGRIVELTDVHSVFKRPLHPYTQGLLASVPVLTGPASRQPLHAIPGHLPDPRRRLPGCRFAARCPQAMPRCSEAEPALTSLDETHQVRCFLHGEAARPVEERLP
jgi:oligopeptide/dipeptide ABC transporter ATP-binding protein